MEDNDSNGDSESSGLSDFYRDAIHQLTSAIEFEDGEYESTEDEGNELTPLNNKSILNSTGNEFEDGENESVEEGNELTPLNKKSILNLTWNENDLIKSNQSKKKPSEDVEELLSILEGRDVTPHCSTSKTLEPEELLEQMYNEKEEKVKEYSTNIQVNSTVLKIDAASVLEKCTEKSKNDIGFNKVEAVIDLTHEIPVEVKIEQNDVSLPDMLTQSRLEEGEVISHETYKTNLNLIEEGQTKSLCEQTHQSVFNRLFNEISTNESYEEYAKIKQALIFTNAFHDVDNKKIKKLIKKESRKTREKYSSLQESLQILSSKFEKHLKTPKKRSHHKRKKNYSRSRPRSSTRHHDQLKQVSQSRTNIVRKYKSKSRSNSSHEDNSDLKNSRSHSNQRSTKHTKYPSLKLYRPRRSLSSCSSPEQPPINRRKKRFSESSRSRSSSPVIRRSRKRTRSSSSSSSSPSSFRHKTTSRKPDGSLFARSTAKSRDIQIFPSSSSTFLSKKTYQQEVRRGDNIITRKAVVTTSYKEELKSFKEKVNEKYYHNDSDNGSDDSLLLLDLQVYDSNNENFTKNRPGGDFNHPFYIHPENAELYRVRTKNGTQPAQALHEICIKCNWKLPTYLNLPSEKGFKFAMVIKEHRFITEKVGQQKKLAKAEIAKAVLQWLRIIDIS